MPPISHSPKRKRVRRYFSASAATGARLSSKISMSGLASTSTSSRTRRRGSSVSSFNFSPDRDRGHASEDSGIEEEHSARATEDNGSGFSQLNNQAVLAQARQPLTYASLPPTPISASPPLHLSPPYSPISSAFPSQEIYYDPPFSIWDYLREELLATDFDSHQELKWERVSNFVNMPVALEKVRLP